MRRAAWAAAAVVVIAAPAGAQVQPADTAGVHVVRRGDTLWDLAQQYLANPFRWPDIYRLNDAVVADPHWIFPQQRLLIPGAAMAVSDTIPRALPPGAEELVGPARVPPRTVFFPDEERLGRTLVGPADVPSPTVAPGEFYAAGLLVPEDQLRPVGWLAEVQAPTVVPMARQAVAQPYDKVYMRVTAAGAVSPGDRLHLMREGRRVRPYGRIFESTGVALVLDVEGGTATLEVEEHYDDVEVGNFAVPLPEYTVPIGVRPGEAGGARGRIVTFLTGDPVPAVRDLAFVDIGRNAGLTEGDELEAVLPPERREWGVRPEIMVARLQVVRVAERTAAVQVVSMEHPALQAGLEVRLVAKMPSS